jgi:hypothetical protein
VLAAPLTGGDPGPSTAPASLVGTGGLRGGYVRIQCDTLYAKCCAWNCLGGSLRPFTGELASRNGRLEYFNGRDRGRYAWPTPRKQFWDLQEMRGLLRASAVLVRQVEAEQLETVLADAVTPAFFPDPVSGTGGQPLVESLMQRPPQLLQTNL